MPGLQGKWPFRALGSALICMGIAAISDSAHAQTPLTGDQRRDYMFTEAGKPMPYRLYVPKTYDHQRAYPLFVVLHGGGSDENAPFDRAPLAELAEKHGVIVVSPLGYGVNGGYGAIYPFYTTRELYAGIFQSLATGVKPPGGRPKVAAAKDNAVELPASMMLPAYGATLSEMDTMNVIERVVKEYNIDPKRMYLGGNSMGALGTHYLGAKYAETWAALAPGGASVAAWAYPFRTLADHRVAVLYLHGEGDENSHAHWAHVLAERAREAGVNAEYLLVPGQDHASAWNSALPQIFDFLLKHKKP